MKVNILQMKKALSAVLFVLLLGVAGATNAWTQSFTVGNLNYSVNDDGVSVTVTGHVNGEDATGELVIPGTVVNNGLSYTVTAIGGYAFYNCYGFTGSLIIPNSVTFIGDWAFENCSGLTTIEIPNSLTSIAYGAFYYCTGLTSVEIPNSVISIGGYAFFYCYGLQSLTVLSETPPAMGSYVFYGANMNIPVYVPCEAEGAYINEGWGGFNNFVGMCSGEITVMANPAVGGTVSGGGAYDFGTSCTVTATANGGYAFANWTIDGRVVSTNAEYTFPVTGTVSLVANFVSATENIVFADDNVKFICVSNWDTNGDGELSYAEAAAVTDLGGAFNNNWNIASFDELQYFISLTSLEDFAFTSCGNITSITLPNSLTYIGHGAFYYCPNLTSITIPKSVTFIGNQAFVFCNELEGVAVESGNTVYDSREDCNAIIITASNTLIAGCKNTTIPNSVTSIGNYAFCGCNNLTSIEIPNSVTYIGWEAFLNCSSLTSVIIPSSVTSIDFMAFASCYELESIIIEANNVVYDSRGGCNAIIETASNTIITGCKNTTIPNSVISIGEGAFSGCTGLASIEIPNSVTSIGYAAFSGCTGLTTIEIPNSVTSIGSYAFNYCPSLTTIEMSNSVTFIDYGTFSGCYSLTSIEIPVSVTSISSNAFSHCFGLQSLTVLPETPPALESDVFTGDNMDIPVFVPCGSERAYINEGWGGFSNFVGMCPGEITVMANPSVGGTVSGGGTYDFGTSCTVTATANGGYAFANWTIDGRVVSSNAEYTFPVTGTVTLVANFVSTDNITFADANVKSICVANWDTNGDGELSYAEAAAVTDLVGAFQWNWDITSFNELQYFISLTTIGYGAFQYCGNLSSVTFPQSLVSIENGAFGGTNLSTITIPRFVTSIGVQVFSYGYGPECIIVESGNSVYDSREGCNAIIETASNTLVVGCKNTTIPNSVTSIGYYAFNGCYGLTAIEIPNSVMSIESNAFSYCNNLQSLTILSETPPALGWYVFSNVNMDIPVYVPCGSVDTYINEGWGGFNNFVGMCPGEITVMANPTVGGTVSGGGTYDFGTSCTVIATANGGYAFANWTIDGRVVSTNAEYTFPVTGTVTLMANFASTNNIVFADDNVKTICVTNWDTNGDGELNYAEAASVTSLGDAFSYNSSISSFNELQYFIGLNSIGYEAFGYCSGLTSIEIPNSVISIESYALACCTGLTSIEIPNSVTFIGDWAFGECSSLTSIEIPSSVTNIGANPFIVCSGLEQIIVEAGNSVYDSRDNCNAIIDSSTNELISGCKNTVIPNSVTSIGNSAFSHCYGLTSIEIPNSVTSIGHNAFSFCYGLTSVEIPNSVTFIGYSAFDSCLSLISIEIPNSVTSIGSSTFYYCPNLISIEIPNSVTSIGDRAFSYCYGLTSIEIPNSVTSIGNYAFYYCSGLQSLTVLSETPPTLDWYVFYGVSMDIPVYVPCGSAEAYRSAEGWNEFPNIYELCAQSQTNTLATGWNWWSTYIEQNSLDGLSMLEESLGGSGLTIKSQDAFVEYSSQMDAWTGGLQTIDNASGYKILVSEGCTSVMNGVMAVPANHPVTLAQGWNWIGYPVMSSQTVTATLSGFEPAEGDIFKGQTSYASYQAGTGWIPSNFVVMPGQSYAYYSYASAPKTLVYSMSRGESVEAVEEEHYWRADYHAYPDNLCVMATATVDGEEQRGEDVELGAFVDGACRGSAKLYYVETLDRYIAFLTVTGQDGEEIEFKLMNPVRDVTFTSEDHITFHNNAVVGHLDQPFTVHFGAMNGLSEMKTNLNIYPNPIDRNVPFTLDIPEGETVAEVLMVNAMGEVVRHEAGGLVQSMMHGISVAGVYMVKVTCKSGNVYMGRVVVK